MAPTTALLQVLNAAKALDEFARLSGERRQFVIDAVLVYGRQAVLEGAGAADQAGRLTAALTN
jgi:hypothetical protein